MFADVAAVDVVDAVVADDVAAVGSVHAIADAIDVAVIDDVAAAAVVVAVVLLR